MEYLVSDVGAYVFMYTHMYAHTHIYKHKSGMQRVYKTGEADGHFGAKGVSIFFYISEHTWIC